MDKEDLVQMLLSTLLRPQWKCTNSVTDWDLKGILWSAGLLLSPEQVAALLADTKRRGLIAAQERRSDRMVCWMWGVRITSSGEDWLRQRPLAAPAPLRRRVPSPPAVQPVETRQGDLSPKASITPSAAATGYDPPVSELEDSAAPESHL